MQDRYTGDIGDYFKYALLRHISQGRKLGVAWYLHPNEGHNEDGKHISYLKYPEKWRGCDPENFDILRNIIRSDDRTVSQIETSNILKGASFSSELLQCSYTSAQKRALFRKNWFKGVLSKLHHCDIVFADPDNGLRLDKKFRHGSKKDWKSISENEVARLADG